MKLRLWNLLPHDYAPFFRILHIIVAFLILSQIINSNLTETEAIGEHSLEGVITWMHIISGLGLIICGFIMLSWMLTQRGFTYYFSWVGLDFSGIKQDIKTLTREGANKQIISSQADSLIKISRIWADFFPANTSNQPI